MYEWLTGTLTSIAWCFKLTLTDHTVMGFTSHDQDLLVAGIAYEAATGFSPSAVETSKDMSTDNIDVEGCLTSDRITEKDIEIGRYDNAEIEIFICNWRNLSDPVFILRSGILGEATTGKMTFQAEVNGLLSYLQQENGDVFQKACRATLGDGKCSKDLTAYTFIGTVTAVNADGSFNTNLAQTDKYFDYGLITFTSGENTGRGCEIKEHLQASGELTPFLPLAFPVAAGDTFTIIAGCDGNFSTCKAKFNNYINFRGEPHVPGSDYAATYPATAGASNTVSEGGSVKR
ncbi:MAG: hypothetical protein K0Q85_33 [Caproiciproducens sp.]|jgi:uncharacterized phage protein (TIGR02218 family)|nr:hypothetical protein [Caproiciproducens sp.]